MESQDDLNTMNNNQNSSSNGNNEEKTSASPGELNGEFKDEIKKTIENLETQVKEKESRYLYLYAEFENFKKRAVKERSDLIKFGWESVARDLLGTVDNLELALQHAPAQTDKALMDGLKMVLSQFQEALQKQGVRMIESLHKPFDPHLHEAVGQENSTHPQGHIIHEHSRGYTLHGRLLRPTRVIVSGGPGDESRQDTQRNEAETEKSS